MNPCRGSAELKPRGLSGLGNSVDMESICCLHRYSLLVWVWLTLLQNFECFKITLWEWKSTSKKLNFPVFSYCVFCSDNKWDSPCECVTGVIVFRLFFVTSPHSFINMLVFSVTLVCAAGIKVPLRRRPETGTSTELMLHTWQWWLCFNLYCNKYYLYK